MAEKTSPTRAEALRLARRLGCDGAHQLPDGSWAPCAAPDGLQAIVSEGPKGYEKWKATRQRESLRGEHGTRGISTLPGGGLVSASPTGPFGGKDASTMTTDSTENWDEMTEWQDLVGAEAADDLFLVADEVDVKDGMLDAMMNGSMPGQDDEDNDPSDNEEGEHAVATALRVLLSDVVSFYLRAHGFHWNVEGPDFSEYHALFEAIYSDVYESIDPIAENIRKLGEYAPFTLAAFASARTLDDSPLAKPDAVTLASDLFDANDQVLDTLRQTFHAANDNDEQGVANFIAERIDMHQKWAWQLRSSIK